MAGWKHSRLRVSKKAKLPSVKVGRGCMVDSDSRSGGGVEKEGAGGLHNPEMRVK